MVRTSVQLTEHQASGLKRVAAERCVSVAQVIRDAIDDHLAVQRTMSQRRRRAIAAIGGFHSGQDDVGEEHDRYLE